MHKKVLAWRLWPENEHELEMPLPEKEYVSCPQVFGLKKYRSGFYVRMLSHVCDQIYISLYFDSYELLYTCLLLLPHFIRTDTITTACCFVMFFIRSCSNPFCNWFWSRVWVPKHWCHEQKLLMIEILHHPPLPGWYQITPSIGPALPFKIPPHSFHHPNFARKFLKRCLCRPQSQGRKKNPSKNKGCKHKTPPKNC